LSLGIVAIKISIIVTAFNYADYLQRAIRSCMSQRYVEERTEVVVVDDASDDHTPDVVSPFVGLPRFQYIRHEQNLGVAAAANTGFRAAHGQYVTRVDADDFVSEIFAYFLATYLEHNHDLFGVACDYILVDSKENSLERRRPDEHPIACGVMYRKDDLIKSGLYNDSFRHCEEDELRTRLGERYVVDRLAMPLYRYRMHDTNKTKQAEYHRVRERFRRDE
jgi:glycosyltransferase involved in cell wall biosynthesis